MHASRCDPQLILRGYQGDPLSDSVLLWTRAVPTNGVPEVDVPVCVSFTIHDNAELSGVPLDSGKGFTTYDVDFTVKFEAKNLKPDSRYWYQFADCANPKTVSPIGATRTLADPNSKPTRSRLRIVMVSPLS